jgi:putative hemolysin
VIDIEKEIQKKFPKVDTKLPMIKKSIFKVAKKLIHEDKINAFLKENNELSGFEFIDATLDYFGFDFSFQSNQIENIPATGRVVIVANHPLGALDALCLLKLISKVRKDVKIIANDFLAGIANIDSLLIKIDNFKSKQNKENILRVYKALENEEALIIFPAGEVSRVTPTGIKDGKWEKGFLKFAKKTKSPILPILVDGKNSKTFYTVSLLNKTFSTILLSNEMFKQQNKIVNLEIGKLIEYENIFLLHTSIDALPEMYKKHLYGLKKNKNQLFKTSSPIAHGEDRKSLKKELKQSELLGTTNDGKKIYLYSYMNDGTVLKEIGRLREVSFRKVQEGVNKKRDIDKFDKYYKHIVLWDDEELEIVGAYRIGIAEEIYEEYEFDGFYANTLFKFQKDFLPFMENSIELGRSFVQPKYWGTRALDYLWYGIGAYLKNNPQIKYMYGPVSLSGSFPQYAKELMVDFYSNYFKGNKKIVESKNPFEYETKNIALENNFSFQDYSSDFKILKDKLKSIDLNVPTLYKQYSELCEEGGVKFYGFNIDPDFNDCVDGFIVVEVAKIKESKKERYIK